MKKRLLRMNKEQEKTIISLCEELGIDYHCGYISELLGKKESSDSTTTNNLSNDLNFIQHCLEYGNPIDNNNEVAELQKILQDKENSIIAIKIRIDEYMKQADEYERRLEENEREKDELLNQFQNAGQSKSKDGSMQLSDLEKTVPQEQNLYIILQSKEAEISDLKYQIEKTKRSISSLTDDIESLKRCL